MLPPSSFNDRVVRGYLLSVLSCSTLHFLHSLPETLKFIFTDYVLLSDWCSWTSVWQGSSEARSEYKSLAVFNEKTVSLKLLHLIKVRCSKSYLLPDMVTDL